MDFLYLILAYICGLGTMYGIMVHRNSNYDGQMVVTLNDEDKLIYVLELDGDPSDLKGQKVVKFKVTDREGTGYGEME